MIVNENEIISTMKEIHNYLKNLNNPYDKKSFLKIVDKAKTVGIRIEFEIALNQETDEEYLDRVDLEFDDNEDIKYSKLWCKATNLWAEHHFNKLNDLITDYCEEHGLNLFKILLKFDKGPLSIELLIKNELDKRKLLSELDNIVRTS